MKAILKNKLLLALTLAITLFASYSCEDKDVFVFPEPADSEKTALEVMQDDPDFAQFLNVVDLCGSDCADSLFNQSKVYTIFVPVEGSLDIASIEERIANGDREGVFKEYVESHIANFRHPANGEINKELLMLNNKRILFSGNPQDGYTFGGQPVVAVNIQVKNAIIHKIGSPFDYKASIWESLKSVSSVSAFWDFCSQFTEKIFDPYNSTLGDIVNQEQTYRDSAFYETNAMLSTMGAINNEDSLLLAYIPSNELWEEIYSSSAEFFNYNTEEFTDKQKKEADSIAHIRGVKSYLQYFTYSMSDQRIDGVKTDFDNLPDSLAVRTVSYPRKKYPTAEFNVIEVKEASNGRINVVDAMPINPFNLWVDTIRLEPDAGNNGEFYNVRKDEDGNQVLNADASYEAFAVSKREQNPDVVGKLSNERYLIASQPTKSKSTSLPRITFFVKNVLSTKYKIALITPPWFIKSYSDTIIPNKTSPQYNDSYLRVSVRQNNELLGMFPSDSVSYKKQGKERFGVLADVAIKPDKSRIDTIFLKDANGEDFIFNFKHCEDYSGLTELKVEDDDYTVEIKVELLLPLVKKGNSYAEMGQNDFAYRFLLDQIMLIPVESENSSEPEEPEEEDTDNSESI